MLDYFTTGHSKSSHHPIYFNAFGIMIDRKPLYPSKQIDNRIVLNVIEQLLANEVKHYMFLTVLNPNGYDHICKH